MTTQPRFSGGRNIAMKVPSHQFDATVAFYRDVLVLPIIERFAPDVVFQFGDNQLWIDKSPHLSQAETWLEVTVVDPAEAATYLAAKGVQRRDEIENLPDGFPGFWVANPANIIHLVSQTGD